MSDQVKSVSALFPYLAYTDDAGVELERERVIDPTLDWPVGHATDLFTAGGLTRIDDTEALFGTPVRMLDELAVDQSSATGATPVLFLDQGDDDETMIEFAGAIGTGNVIEAVGAKTLTVTHFIKVEITGVGIRYMPVGTIA